MKRKLISQMRNEWRSNVWMSVELTIVGAVLFGIFVFFALLAYMHRPPQGIDFTDIYVGGIEVVPGTSSGYRPYADSLHNASTDLEMLKINLRANPYVESVGTGSNAIPYNYNYNGARLSTKDADSTIYYFGNNRLMDPDMIVTLRVSGYNGESPDQLAEMVKQNKVLISIPEDEDGDFDAGKWVGHEVCIGRDSTNLLEVGATIHGIRRVDYEPLFNGVMINNIGRNHIPAEIAVRVKAGKGREFLESLDESQLEFGNLYISNMQSIDNIKEAAHRQFSTLMRNLGACTLFLMIAVFLGILGSFWYRTQQRIPEIALRKVNGATDRDIMRRFLSEGLMILLVSTPFIVIIPVLITQSGLNINEYIPP